MKRALLVFLIIAIVLSAYGFFIDKAVAGEQPPMPSSTYGASPDVAAKQKTPLGIQTNRAPADGDDTAPAPPPPPPAYDNSSDDREDYSTPSSDD